MNLINLQRKIEVLKLTMEVCPHRLAPMSLIQSLRTDGTVAVLIFD